jgi:glucuronoarabinoxylan endo-1,4-beta-xylanase
VQAWFRLAILSLAVGACDGRHTPQGADSQTNWLKACEVDSQCEGLSCVCGLCTRTCQEDAACDASRGLTCVETSDAGVVAQCQSSPPKSNLCMQRCEVGSCGLGKSCIAGVCAPISSPSPQASVDIKQSHQALVGFGASVAYVEADITDHPQRDQLLDAIFKDAGLDVLRLRNRYVETTDLSVTGELISAATARLGHPPGVFLTSWTPPAALKTNAGLACNGSPHTCTLAKNSQGLFDYQGFADYWRASLDAYAKVGVTPDYIGLQNNPNWAPKAGEVFEACRFLPVEGSAVVPVGGKDTMVAYPGLAEAQAAVLKSLSGLEPRPKLLAPETSGSGNIGEYVTSLDLSAVEAFAHHLYGSDPAAMDPGNLATLDSLPPESRRPVFITEMEADGFGTALALYHATVNENAAVYLQNALISESSASTANDQAVIGVDDTSFTPQDPYHALRHFAHATAPGWVRVGASSTTSELLVTAWRSPASDALTVIALNSGTSELEFGLELPVIAGGSEVTRSSFDGAERSASLGAYSPGKVMKLPAHSVMTIALGPM